MRAKKTKGEQRELSGGGGGGGRRLSPSESTAFVLVYAVHPFLFYLLPHCRAWYQALDP